MYAGSKYCGGKYTKPLRVMSLRAPGNASCTTRPFSVVGCAATPIGEMAILAATSERGGDAKSGGGGAEKGGGWSCWCATCPFAACRWVETVRP